MLNMFFNTSVVVLFHALTFVCTMYIFYYQYYYYYYFTYLENSSLIKYIF